MFLISSSSGSGIDKNIPRFIFEASKVQFDMPTKATFFSPSLRSYSNSEWITLRGLFGECSARPISSKKIIDILFLLSSSLNFSNAFLAFLKTFSTPWDVLPIEPWYEFKIIPGNSLNRILFDLYPFIDLLINWTLKDLLHPGFPTINIGTLLFMATNNEKILSNNALFFAIPFSRSILFTTNNSSLWGTSKKSSLLKNL